MGLADFASALADADAALALKPGWSKAHFRRGIALEGLGRLAEAAAAFGAGAAAAVSAADGEACKRAEVAAGRRCVARAPLPYFSVLCCHDGFLPRNRVLCCVRARELRPNTSSASSFMLAPITLRT